MISNFDHIVLYLFLFLLYIYWGKKNYDISEHQKFWAFAIIPILVYSVIVGSRYGWGPDYPFYKFRFENAFTFPEEQIAFKYLNQGMNLLGFNYVGCYVFYSLIFITCAFFLIRSYGIFSKYMYAFILPATLLFISSAIRQGVSLSFLLLVIYALNQKKWLLAVVFAIIAMLIHSATLISIAVLVLFYFFFSNKPLTWKISIPLYLFFTFIFDVSKIGFISNFLQTISIGGKFQSYLDNADGWFGADAIEDKFSQGLFPLIMSSIFYIGIIFMGYFALNVRSDRKIIYIYNYVVLGIIFYRIVFLYQILRRLAEPMVMLNFIVLGYAFYIFYQYKQLNIFSKQMYISNNKTKTEVKIFDFLIVGIICYLVLFWGRFIFLNENSLFFWNI